MAAWRASGRRSSVRRGGGGPPGALSHKAILERPVGDSCRIVTPADRAFDNVRPMGGDPRRSALTACFDDALGELVAEVGQFSYSIPSAELNTQALWGPRGALN
jgi:hypothetical protein